MGSPLAEYQVLDFSRYGPGPYCSMLLGDLGADVIAVDDGSPDTSRGRRIAADDTADGDMTRPLEFMRRNARRIALDLKHPAGREVVERLVDRTDVLIESFRPGVAERLGIGHESLRARHPRLVYCSISGYGQSGPYRDWQGHDINYLALGGLLALTGQPDQPPAIPGTLVADLAGGGLPAAVAILGALLARERDDVGQYIDVSIQEGVTALISPMIALALANWPVSRGRSVVTGGAPWYRVYETSDGRFITVGAIEPWLYAELCRRLGRPEWADRQYDQAYWPVMALEMEHIFKEQSLSHWRAMLEPAGVCVTGVHDLSDVLADPQLAARGALQEPTSREDGRFAEVHALPRMSGHERRPSRPPTAHGADWNEILTELGYGHDEREGLRSSGVLG